MNKETRSINSDLTGNSDELKVQGKAIVFDSLTMLYEENGRKYYEKIDRHALDNCDFSDVCLKYNHNDSTPILARTRGGSLKITTRMDGVYFEAKMFDTQHARDCLQLVKGDALQCSFAFLLPDDGFTYDAETRTRTIINIPKLIDLSLVSQPAYADTYVKQARSFFQAEAIQELERAQERKNLKLAAARFQLEELVKEVLQKC